MLRSVAGLALHPLTLLTVGALVLRFIAVQGLVVPNWGDSLHHTLITQLFLEQGGVPGSYRPYVPVDSFTYHFGFHGLSALWAWLSGQTSWSSVISVGQALNALTVPAAYVLTRQLFGSRAAALGSAVVVGFLSGMPTQYVNFGRYTQLAGQVLLPFALVWLLRWVEACRVEGKWLRRTDWPRLALASIGVAGLALTHYRVLIFYALFVLAYIAAEAGGTLGNRRATWQARRARLGQLLGRTLAVGALGGLLFAPWLARLVSDYLGGLFTRLGGANESYLNVYANEAFLTQFVGWVLPLLAALGFGAALLWGPSRSRRMALAVVSWTGLLFLSARPDAVGLPGGGAVGTYTVGIMLYMPLGTLAGVGIGRLTLFGLRLVQRWMQRQGEWKRIGRGVRALPGALAALAAALLTVANPGARTIDFRFAYVTPHDLDTLNWVRLNTPPGSRFLISAESSYGGRATTATDAGMWLPLLAGGGRSVSVPPLSVGSEGKQAADFTARVRSLYRASQAITTTESLDTLRQEGFNYVYLGEQKTAINPTVVLEDKEHFCLLYRREGSYVFGVRGAEGVCPDVTRNY